MTINLNNLNLSLDTFNNIASGNYNIGEVQLTADGQGLTKVNNHKNTWFFSNNTSVSSEEALAIKNAFVKALSDSGMGPEALAAIREQLGITNAVELLKNNTVKPLTRQEIRDIIDQNSGTINQNRQQAGQEALKTSDQIYAGKSVRTMATHQAIRNRRNEQLASSRKMVMNYDVKNLMTILTGEFAGKQEQSGDISNMALAMRSATGALLENKGGNIGSAESIKIGEPMVTEANGSIQITFRLDNERFYKVDTKLTVQDFLQKMDSVPKSDSWVYISNREDAIEKLTNDTMKGLFSTMKADVISDARQMTKRIFEENFNDKEVTDLLAHTLKYIVNKDNSPRNEDSVRQRVEAFKETVAKLRELEKTRPGVFEAGMSILKQTPQGKCFKTEHFTLIMEAVDKINFGLLAASRKPSIEDIHKFFVSALNELDNASLRPGDRGGMDEDMQLHLFILNFAILNLSPQQMMDIRATLRSPEFANLHRIYMNAWSGQIGGDRGFEVDRGLLSKWQKIAMLPVQLNQIICDACGIVNSDLDCPADVDNPTEGISDEILDTFRPQQANIQP